MRGLWIKDMNLLKGQKQFWIGIGAIAVIILGWTDNTAFVICYIAIVTSMFAINTMGYDEMQNGLSYLFTLPVSRKSYLKEKYLFGAFLSVVGMLGASLAAAAVCLFKRQELDGEAFLGAMAAGVIVSVLIMAVMLPLQVKFGSEKGRMVVLAIYGMCFLLGAAGKKLFPEAVSGMFASADRFLEAYPAAAIAGSCGMGLLFIAVSYLTAVRFMKKKQL